MSTPLLFIGLSSVMPIWTTWSGVWASILRTLILTHFVLLNMQNVSSCKL